MENWSYRGGKFEQLICNVSSAQWPKFKIDRQFYKIEFQIKVDISKMKRKAAISAEALMSENANPGGSHSGSYSGSRAGQPARKRR